MKLGKNYCIIHQSLILDEQEVNDHFEEFLTWIMSHIDLKTISKASNAKCIGNTRIIIDSKLAKHFQFDFNNDYSKETEEYKITFAFDKSEQEKFIQKVNAFWTEKVMTT